MSTVYTVLLLYIGWKIWIAAHFPPHDPWPKQTFGAEVLILVISMATLLIPFMVAICAGGILESVVNGVLERAGKPLSGTLEEAEQYPLWSKLGMAGVLVPSGLVGVLLGLNVARAWLGFLNDYMVGR